MITSRTAVDARVFVTERMRPLRIEDHVVHQIWMPYHWGGKGLIDGDVVNDLLGVVADPNVFIQESKVATCDIQPGRRPRGPALLGYVASYATVRASRCTRERIWTRRGHPRRTPRRRSHERQQLLRTAGRPGGRRGLRASIRRALASSPTRRCASAARRARWPARSGTGYPTTGSTCWACRSTTRVSWARTRGGTWRSSSSRQREPVDLGMPGLRAPG